MKKEEFPTFLNEQPTVIFGRTGRELLIIVCGLFVSYQTGQGVSSLLPGVAGSVLGIFLAALVLIGFLILALVKVGYRQLEEWIFAWFLFIAIPKIYLYKPSETESSDFAEDVNGEQWQKAHMYANDLHDLNQNLERE